MTTIEFADDLDGARTVLQQQSRHPITTIIDAAEALSIFAPDHIERQLAAAIVKVAKRSVPEDPIIETIRSLAWLAALGIVVYGVLSFPG